MTEIRFHGRGGQGAVLACRLLAAAAFESGSHCQAFPEFGLERRGAPVLAFTRISPDPISIRGRIVSPHHALVLDASLLKLTDVTEGLRPGGWIIVNTEQQPENLPLPGSFRVAAVNASEIAIRHRLGSRVSPIVNTAILGAFARATGVITIENLQKAVRDNVAVKTDNNILACKEAFEKVILNKSAQSA